jgi:N6-L-threonylcarbamoyladenine synthase
MKILSIETSCDETSAAVIEYVEGSFPKVLSLITATSLETHKKTGGIIPENAARAQVEYMLPVIIESLTKASEKKLTPGTALSTISSDIDAIAVTYGPGLIGSLLVGVETAKTLAYIYNKPLIPVHHLLAHLYANWLVADSVLHVESSTTHHTQRAISFPFIGLIVSGGHTDLLYFKSHEEYTWIGGTRDDAAGEAFDKIGRILQLPYPAGPEIEKKAKKATEKKLRFSRGLKHSEDFDFSFSGLKSEAARYIQKQDNVSDELQAEISYAVQDAITDVLVHKTLKAAEKYNCKTILLGGGVSANEYLRKCLNFEIRNSKFEINLFFPEKKYTTDNAAMIGTYAALHYTPTHWHLVSALPNLYFE